MNSMGCLFKDVQTNPRINKWSPDVYLFVERGKRGGMYFIGHRYAETNNKDMDNFDTTKESSYLMYFDANSLYSWAMCNPIPVGKFKWGLVKKDIISM